MTSISKALNTVEVQKIQVKPLGEWSFLMRKHPPHDCSWPRSSNLLCWWCSHSFQNVPAFLPVHVEMDAENRMVKAVFSGNFCSWNCVKRYALMLDAQGKLPSGCFYIGLIAFLTVCKGERCEGGDVHDLGLCDCVDHYRGVKAVESRERLESFGGDLSIDQYRQGFHVITDYDKVQTFFGDVTMLASVKKAAMASANRKYWGFRYLHYRGPDTSYVTTVNILPLTNRTFDRKTLVNTGNESLDAAQKLGGTGKSDGEIENHVETKRKASQPRGRRISRRRMSVEPTLVSSSLSMTTTTTTTTDGDALGSSSSIPAAERIMTSEQSLACNEEQSFYTNSLRGFGNILESMGIEVTRPCIKK